MEGSREKRPHAGRFVHDPPIDWLIASLALSQHGVVELSQLLDLGLSASAVRSRVAAGRLHRVHAGVYAVGHAPLTLDGAFMAAVLACGRDSVLSHRSAGHKLGLRSSARTAIDVTTPRQGGRCRRGIDAHTCTTLLARDIIEIDGIRCTSVARTLLDLAAVLPRDAVERAFDQAELLQILDARAIEDVLHRARGHRGSGMLRSILADHRRRPALTRKGLEMRFLNVCRRAQLTRPEVNAWIPWGATGYEADFLWRAERLIAEVDGRDVHATRRSFEHDRHRDQQLMLAGFQVIRFTWRQVTDDPRGVETTLRALLKQAA
jgi:very-short-patch-repair endonuclease